MTNKAALWCTFALACIVAGTTASKVHDSIYTALSGKLSCNRLMNEQEEIGCQSPIKGASGVLFKVATASDLNYLLNSAPSDEYIPLVATTVFASNSSLNALLRSSRVTGILVYDDNTTNLQWSPDSILPSSYSGLPFSNPPQWNKAGGGYNRRSNDYTEGSAFLDYGIPIFFLDPTDNAAVFKCYNSYNAIQNGIYPSYPLCGVELNSFMWGAKDTPTCLRRGYCDPLANQSPYAFLRVLSTNEQVVLVSAQTDSMSFFHDLTYGAEADASGVVVALVAAELLGRPTNYAVRSLGRNIMFSLFNGEAFGYIGSSRVAYDIINGKFPVASNPISFSRISHMLELNQLALANGTVHLFAATPAATAVQQVVTSMQMASTSLNASLTVTAETGELPPASLRAFLKEMTPAQVAAFGGVVATGFGAQSFTNKAYHSHLDNAANIQYASNTSLVVSQLCKLAAVVAKTAWALASGSTATFTMPDENADCNMVASLLQCMTVDQGCSYATQFVSALTPAGRPMSRYIGVFPNGVDPATLFLQKVLGYSVALNRSVPVATASCVTYNNAAAAQYYTLPQGKCMITTTYSWAAQSPAFYPDGSALRPVGAVTNGGRDTRYPTWTEARWGSVSSRMFLVDSPSQQAKIIGGGCAALVISFGLVLLAQRYLVLPPAART